MPGHGQKLSYRREQALSALLACSTVQEAARASRITERTLQRWLADEDFRRDLREAQRAVLADAIGEIQAATLEAVRELRAALKCDHAPTRVKAAIAIIDRALRGREIEELEARLAALEDGLRSGAWWPESELPPEPPRPREAHASVRRPLDE